MSGYGVTNKGFLAKTTAVTKQEIESDLKASLGENINLLPESVLGQIVGIFSERENKLWELAEDIYNSQYPNSSEGVSLENVCALTGITKKGATKSQVKGQLLFGDTGTIVLKGTVISVEGNPNARFITDTDSEPFIEGEETTVDLTAESTGPIQAPAGTLTVIETPISGLTSTENPEDAILGRNIETDSELRLRREESLQIAAASTVEAIRAKLLELDNVEQVLVIENDTMETVTDRPPKSFETIVKGGDEIEIAKSLFEAKPAGIETYGQIVEQVTDTQGFNYEIKFSRPTVIPIYLILDLTTTSSYPVNGDDFVLESILDFSMDLQIGEDVIVYPQLIGVLDKIPGITNINVKIGIEPDPTGDENILINPDAIAEFDSGRITINS